MLIYAHFVEINIKNAVNYILYAEIISKLLAVSSLINNLEFLQYISRKSQTI